MENWFLSALMALVIYGFWGFLPKLAMQHLNPTSALIYQVVGGGVIGVLALLSVGFRPDTNPSGILFAVLTGATGIVGTFFYYYAASRGPITLVVSITALYPIITILLAVVFLKEALTLKQIAGMFFAFLAIFLLSSST